MTLPTTTASRIATDQPRKRSILEPLLAPVPEPYATSANALIPMSLAPRSNAATLIRPLVLPSPPTSPTTLTTPVPAHVPTRPLCCNLDQQHESPSVSLWRQRTLPYETFARSGTAEYVSNVRKLDTLPMFRFSDLCNVHESAIARSYVTDQLHTPGLAPYSIAAMLNEPESPDPPTADAGMSKQESSDNSQRDDRIEMGVRPLSALPTPTHQLVPSNSPAHETMPRGNTFSYEMETTTTLQALEGKNGTGSGRRCVSLLAGNYAMALRLDMSPTARCEDAS